MPFPPPPSSQIAVTHQRLLFDQRHKLNKRIIARGHQNTDPSLTHFTSLGLELIFHERRPAPTQPLVNPFHNRLTRSPSSMQDNTKAANQLTKKTPPPSFISARHRNRFLTNHIGDIFLFRRCLFVYLSTCDLGTVQSVCDDPIRGTEGSRHTVIVCVCIMLFVEELGVGRRNSGVRREGVDKVGGDTHWDD